MSLRVANGPNRALEPGAGGDHSWIAPGALLVWIAAISVLMTASGAFDTDNLGLAHRLTLWTTVAGLIVGQAIGLDWALSGAAPEGTAGRSLAAAGAVVLTIGLMTFELHALKYTPLLPKEPDPLLAFALFLAPPVGAIAGFAVMLRIGLAHGPSTRSADPGRRSGSPTRHGEHEIHTEAPIAELSAWPMGEVLSVRAQDHYLEVVTASGRAFVRGRMADAAARLARADGLRVHRSWWVARSNVAHARRNGRDYALVLKTGEEAPVGRSRTAELRKRGWL